ncbi:MAG: DUF429 domain-containing protein [Anaerolineae bacterium]|nr:DUF429 domain-containing protein [Anaerolineae bacterium]
MLHRYVYGVDFSGASDAGKFIWIAEGALDGADLCVMNCYPAEALDDSGRPRHLALTALSKLIASSEESVFGFDFPFSLPNAQLRTLTWLDFARAFGKRYPTAEVFYSKHGGKGNEQRRITDERAKPPFAPANLRMYRQTYYGIRDLLAPLALSGQACVLPMMKAKPSKPWLIETCPAVTLRNLDLRLVQYKERGDSGYERRATILQGLETIGVHLADEALRTRVLENERGDALDSVIAALGTARALQAGTLAEANDPVIRREGWIYP